MKKLLLISFLFASLLLQAQKKIVKTVESDAPYVEIKTDGIDNLIIEESDTNELEMIINDRDGLGFVENFSCNDYNCVLNIKTEIKINEDINNKINAISMTPPTHVSAVVKIPKGKKVTVFGTTIDIQTDGYDGILRILIDNGTVKLKSIKGITEVDLFSGAVFADIDKNSLQIKTKKGTISVNGTNVKSPYKKKENKKQRLIVKTINANVVLTEPKN